MTSKRYALFLKFLNTLQTSDYSMKSVGKKGNSYYLAHEVTLIKATLAPMSENLEQLDAISAHSGEIIKRIAYHYIDAINFDVYSVYVASFLEKVLFMRYRYCI